MNQVLSRIASLPMNRVLTLAGALAVSYFFFFTYDVYDALGKKIDDVKKQIEVEKGKEEDTKRTLKKELEVKDSVALLSQQYEKIAKSLPSVLTPSDIMAFIDGFAKASKVKVTSKIPQTVVKKEIVEELPVSILLTGTYFEIGRFIQQASTFEPITKISNYRIFRDPNSSSGKYSLEGRVLGYRSLENKIEEKKK